MTASALAPATQDDLVGLKSAAPPTGNPIASAATITLSLPENVEVRLVDASALSEYELWALLTSILSSAVIGFTVATMQAPETTWRLFMWVTIVFGLLLLVCAGTTYFKRRRLSAKSRRVRFRLGDPITE